MQERSQCGFNCACQLKCVWSCDARSRCRIWSMISARTDSWNDGSFRWFPEAPTPDKLRLWNGDPYSNDYDGAIWPQALRCLSNIGILTHNQLLRRKQRGVTRPYSEIKITWTNAQGPSRGSWFFYCIVALTTSVHDRRPNSRILSFGNKLLTCRCGELWPTSRKWRHCPPSHDKPSHFSNIFPTFVGHTAWNFNYSSSWNRSLVAPAP